MRKPGKLVSFFVSVIFFFFLIAVINRMLLNQMNTMTKKQESTVSVAEETTAEPQEEVKAVDKIILRIETKKPDDNYTESVIIVDKEEICRLKMKSNRVVEQEGSIPEGKIKFVKKWGNTYGYEYFRKGKRQGIYQEYYSNDQIKEKAEYSNDRLLKRKSYFYDGSLRVEEDRTEARFMSIRLAQNELKYAGKGKIYRSDGSLKFEWLMVDNFDNNYTRAYDRDGKMTEEKIFDGQGIHIVKEEASQPVLVNPMGGS